MKKKYLYMIIALIGILLFSLIYTQLSFRHLAPGPSIEHKDEIQKNYAGG